MAKKVYTVQLDNKNLSSKASKNAKVKVSKSQEEIEKFGVVEINNKSCKNKIKNMNDAGYEKHILSAEKKAVKTNISKVDDYFDFSFRPTQEKTSVKPVEKKTVKNASVSANSPEIMSDAQICNTYALNDEANKIVSIARAGSLFG